MEEKERYIIGKGEDIFIADNDRKVMFTITTKKLQDLLNQQAKRIKELEEELKNEEELHDLCIEDNQKDKDFLRKQIKHESDARNRFMKENQQLKQQLAESEVKIANLEVLLLENANDRKAMQEFKIGEDEYDLTDEDARNALCWEVKELKQQLEEYKDVCHKHHIDCPANLDRVLLGMEQQVEELKGERLKFYNDDVRLTQVINGVHFDIEQLLVFSEYVEHEKNISADKDKQINQLKHQLHELPKKIVEEIKKMSDTAILWWSSEVYDYTITAKNLDTILKKYGGEDESNNSGQ